MVPGAHDGEDREVRSRVGSELLELPSVLAPAMASVAQELVAQSETGLPDALAERRVDEVLDRLTHESDVVARPHGPVLELDLVMTVPVEFLVHRAQFPERLGAYPPHVPYHRHEAARVAWQLREITSAGAKRLNADHSDPRDGEHPLELLNDA